MDLKPSDVILSIVESNKGTIEGRTTIQKLVYFVGVKTDDQLVMDFRPHYYGPYSPSVATVLERLIGLNFLRESPRYTSRDHILYCYSLTPDGQKVIAESMKAQPNLYKSIRSVVRLAKKFSGLNPDILSFAAKAHYILAIKRRPVTANEISQEGRKFGWDLTEENVGRGVKLLLALQVAK